MTRFPAIATVAGAFVVLALVFVGWELSREFRSVEQQRAATDRSYETRSQIQRVFSLMQDAETGQRGFIITGDPAFLAPYEAAGNDLDEQMAVLTRLLAHDARQSADLDRLEGLISAKREIMARTIEERRTIGFEPARAIVTSGVGKTVMDEIRAVVGQMIAREATHLQTASASASARTERTERFVAALFLALIVLTVGGGFLFWRYLTTRSRLLTEVSAQAARQEAIFNGAIDAIITLNPSGSIESINRAGQEMFGYTDAELNRRDISLLVDIAADGAAPFLQRLGEQQGALDRGLVRELSGKRRDGEVFPADVALGAMELPTGIHVVAIIRDISERKRVEELKDEFVSTVSHELRTPMTSISGALGLLTGGAAGALPEQAVRLVSIAHSNSQRLVRLINDILDIEKIESGKLALVSEPLDLRDVALRSIDGVSGYAAELGVEINLSDGPAAPVRGDNDRLVQVVVNLLSNAAKFSPKGGEVQVSVFPERRLARLSVRDFGPGVPEGFRARIFSRFAQADGSDTRTRGGTGLGLAISREIAERHGGRLWFESAPGEGSIFHLDLPLDLPMEQSAVIGAPRLLIVEDDKDAADILRDLLESDGFDAQVTASAEEAYLAATTGTFDAMLVDLILPDGDGIGLIRRLRETPSTQDIPVIVISGDVARGKARGSSLEVLDWLDKPIDAKRLRSAVNGVFATGDAATRVLHVEDDTDIIAVVATTLSGIAEIEVARSLGEARQAMARRQPDLVILDLGLPDGSGLDLLPELTSEDGREVPVIVYSAQDTDAALKQGVDAVLTKSRASLTTLARTVRRLTSTRDEDKA